MKKSRLLTLCCITISYSAFANYPIQPLPIGNFVVPISQRPRPLFCFGQNLVEEGNLLGADALIFFEGQHKNEFVNSLTVLYGITDDLHTFVNVPVPAFRRVESTKKGGLGEINIQTEYVFFERNTLYRTAKATVIGTVYFPTGILIDPSPVNFSSYTLTHSFTAFLAAGTFGYTTFDWYFYTILGNLFPRKNENSQLGQVLFYEFAVGHNLGRYSDKVLALTLEFYGTYQKQTLIDMSYDPNSGGNTFFLAGAFWYSTDRVMIQAGVNVPVLQHLRGTQTKASFVLMWQGTWTFQ